MKRARFSARYTDDSAPDDVGSEMSCIYDAVRTCLIDGEAGTTLTKLKQDGNFKERRGARLVDCPQIMECS